MKHKRFEEHSAGGILISMKDGIWHVLLIRDPKKHWTFPKGKIEKGEDALIAARREIEEEVGISDLTYKIALAPIHYWYTRQKTIYKTVTYYIFETPRAYTPKPQLDEGITEAKWVPLRQAESIIGYPDTHKTLLSHVRHMIR